ncbi:MAG: hypothetical protein AAF433_21395 [Bacteroidota bacterium]
MPANTKYLSSIGAQISKLIAAIFGGYLASAALHIGIAKAVPNDTPVLLTATYSMFLVWCGLMVMVYLIRKAWVSWAILLLITLFGGYLIFSF